MKSGFAEKQKLRCSECEKEFEFDPNSEEHLIVTPDSKRKTKTKIVEVTAYLECPSGHIKPYRVKKDYEELKSSSLWSKLQRLSFGSKSLEV